MSAASVLRRAVTACTDPDRVEKEELIRKLVATEAERDRAEALAEERLRLVEELRAELRRPRRGDA